MYSVVRPSAAQRFDQVNTNTKKMEAKKRDSY